MATERRKHLQRRGTMDEIIYLIEGLKSGEFTVCDEDEEASAESAPKSQLDRRLDRLSSSLESIRVESDLIRTHANLLLREVHKLHNQNDHMEECVTELEMDIDDFDMYNRENNVLIIGLPEYYNEDPVEATLDLFREKLDLHLERDSIVSAERISQKRHLMVQFYDSDHKEMVIHARRKLKGSRIAIYEDLSPRRFDLLNQARSVEGVNAWTVRGRITAIQNFVKYRVDCIADVAKLQDNAVQSKSTPRCIFRYRMI